MPSRRVRLYREFLTPALHRRFTKASAGILLICYIEAILIGSNPSLLWSWFPFGFAGIRTLLIFLSALTIFILRVAQLHFGTRVTKSPFDTLQKSLSNLSALRTPAFYLFSAWWFNEVYKWSASKHADLGLVAEGKSYERQRLNERPIYLFILVLVLAISQSGLHIYHDYDSLDIPDVPIQAEDGANDVNGRPPSPLEKVKLDTSSILFRIVCQVGVVNLITPIIYMILRRWAWNPALFLARLIWSIPKASEPSWRPPFLSLSMPWRALMMSTLLICLWEAANTAFLVYVSQEPLKMGRPLTSDSMDPNGSLLTGLKAKKHTVRSFAYWELDLISRSFEARRSTIFTEIERAGGSTWSQILEQSLSTIRLLEPRIVDFTSSNASKPKAAVKVESLPRILTSATYLDGTTPPRSESQGSDLLLSFSMDQSSGKQAPPSPSRAVKLLLQTAQTKLLSQAQQQALSNTKISTTVHSYLSRILNSPLGHPFRQPFPRSLAAVFFSTPYSDAHQMIHATDAITRIVLASLKEDRYGLVNSDVWRIMRTFASTVRLIEEQSRQMRSQWTHAGYDGDGTSSRPLGRGSTTSTASSGVAGVEWVYVEADLLVEHLRTGLERISDAFADYEADLGIGKDEILALRCIGGVDGRKQKAGGLIVGR